MEKKGKRTTYLTPPVRSKLSLTLGCKTWKILKMLRKYTKKKKNILTDSAAPFSSLQLGEEF